MVFREESCFLGIDFLGWEGFSEICDLGENLLKLFLFLEDIIYVLFELFLRFFFVCLEFFFLVIFWSLVLCLIFFEFRFFFKLIFIFRLGFLFLSICCIIFCILLLGFVLLDFFLSENMVDVWEVDGEYIEFVLGDVLLLLNFRFFCIVLGFGGFGIYFGSFGFFIIEVFIFDKVFGFFFWIKFRKEFRNLEFGFFLILGFCIGGGDGFVFCVWFWNKFVVFWVCLLIVGVLGGFWRWVNLLFIFGLIVIVLEEGSILLFKEFYFFSFGFWFCMGCWGVGYWLGVEWFLMRLDKVFLLIVDVFFWFFL